MPVGEQEIATPAMRHLPANKRVAQDIRLGEPPRRNSRLGHANHLLCPQASGEQIEGRAMASQTSQGSLNRSL